MSESPNQPRLTGSDTVFEGRVFKVRRDRLQTGVDVNMTREVVEHPGAIAVLALTKNDRVVLVSQYRHPAGTHLLEVPAGTREPNEAPAETAARELLEETGYRAAQLREVLTFFTSPGYTTERVVLMLATGCRRDPEARGEAEVEVSTLAVAELASLVSGPKAIEDAKTLIALQWLQLQRAAL